MILMVTVSLLFNYMPQKKPPSWWPMFGKADSPNDKKGY